MSPCRVTRYFTPSLIFRGKHYDEDVNGFSLFPGRPPDRLEQAGAEPDPQPGRELLPVGPRACGHHPAAFPLRLCGDLLQVPLVHGAHRLGPSDHLHAAEVLHHHHLLRGSHHLDCLWFRSVERWSGVGVVG